MPSSQANDTDAIRPAVGGEGLQQAVHALLAPLARLAVARGMPCAAVEMQLRQAFVQAANEAHASLPPHRRVSRIATATGLNRREVTRLTQAAQPPVPRRPLTAELFARWTGDSLYRDARGRPLALPRQGPAPSFETLAHSITRDVHPRSLLDELLRLGLAVADADADTVRLVREAFVPRGDAARMLGFLGQNVGDHLSAAVANVLGDGRQHFEQAVFADELSAQSLETARATIASQWQALSAALVPQLAALIEADRAAGRPQDQRLRVGLFSYGEPMPSTPGAAPAAPAAAGMPRSQRSRPHRSQGDPA